MQQDLELKAHKTNCLSDCQICNGTGWVDYENEDGLLFSKPCECGLLERMKQERQLRFASLPEKFKDCTLKDLKVNAYSRESSQKQFISACKSIKFWLDNYEQMAESGMGLYLYSEIRGSGKTRVAVSIANELMRTKNIPVKFATTIDIIAEIKRCWSKESDYECESALLDALANTEVLIIDDFSAEVVKDWVNDKFYSIINGRYVNNRVTLFTSNLNLDGSKYDSRITNRIKEKAYIIAFPEESVRDNIAIEKQKELGG